MHEKPMSSDADSVLWAEWSKHYKALGIDPARISRDGAIDGSVYARAPVRVVFVLKEVHSKERTGFPLPKYLRGGPRGKGTMWHAVARWAAGIQGGFPPYSAVNGETAKHEALRASAVVNLKKIGGGSTANMSAVNAYALRDRKLLRRQILALDPQTVIACGTFDSLAWVLDLPISPEKPTAPTRFTQDGFWVVPWRHPGRADAKGTYNRLEETFQSLGQLAEPLK